ncbi:MAG TPA: zf-HC2 domain-containing protein [Acidobacteriota bacterium]|nr:zf-HC2 domain-containing protein [Acidobacteriota bacterium]
MPEVEGPEALDESSEDGRSLDEFLQRIQESCARSQPPSLPSHDCPSAERLWEGAAGQLSPSRTSKLVDHLAECPQCRLEYGLALQMQAGLQQSLPSQVRSSLLRRPWMGIAAGLLAGALGLTLWQGLWTEGQTPALRGRGQPAIEFSVQEEAALPADDFTLRWQVAVEEARYDVSVRLGQGDFRVLSQAQDISRPFHTVPESQLRGLPEGSAIDWLIRVRLPGGETQSHLHRTRLGR